MIPKTGEIRNAADIAAYPTRTYALDMLAGRISGFTDGVAAMRQAVYKILMTERFKYIIYSFNYGTELGKVMDSLYIYALVERYITDALMQDERIRAVHGFKFKKGIGSLSAEFTVDTDEGSFEAQKEVALNV